MLRNDKRTVSGSNDSLHVRGWPRLAWRVLALGCMLHGAWAAEYFVAPTGDDNAEGTIPAQAFRTIARGLDALTPGATLTILPGEYRESIYRTDLSGTPEAPITIRAQRPGTVLLRGDVDVDGFERLEGSLYTWVADIDHEVQGVGEPGTATLYEYVPGVAELDEVSASWFQDPDTGRLYVHTSDGASPETRRLVAGVMPQAPNQGFGLLIRRANDLVIDGLAFSGFLSRDISATGGMRANWGLCLVNPERVTVRNCTAFLNGGGISLFRPVDGLVEDNLAFANWSPHDWPGGNIHAYSPARNTVMRRNVVHSTPVSGGISFYSGGAENCLLEGNIAWDCADAAVLIKGGDNTTSRMLRNVGLGKVYPYRAEARWNLYRIGDGLADDGSNVRVGARFDFDGNFVSPRHHDYRLQSDSDLRGRGPEDSDAGPHPYREEVFFVSPDGDDDAAGTSVGTAWRTLTRAVERAGPGDTVYLLPGLHAGPLRPARSGEEARPITLRGRAPGVGVEPAEDGGPALDLSGLSFIAVEDLSFTGAGTATGSRGVALKACTLPGRFDAAGSRDFSLANSDVGSLDLRGAEGAGVAGILFAPDREEPGEPLIDIDAAARSTLWSDYNAFPAGAVGRFRLDGNNLGGLDAWRAATGHDRHSLRVTARPEAAWLSGRGPMGTPIGADRLARVHLPARVENVRVHSVTATTVNIEWWTPGVETVSRLDWGGTEACENRVEDLFSGGSYHSVSLIGLEPGRRYFFRVAATRPVWEMHANEPLAREQRAAERQVSESEIFEFRTRESDPTPMTYHVAMDGSDSADGRLRERAWRTMRHAADRVRPGDTVLVHEGSYEELVTVRATGEEGRPITFRAAPGARVWIEGSDQNRHQAFRLLHKHHIVIDGFYFRQYRRSKYHSTGSSGIVQISGGSHHVVRRCFYDGRARVYMPAFIDAGSSRNLLMEHCVMVLGSSNARFRHCPGLVVRNNAFYNAQFVGIALWNNADEPLEFTHNLVGDLIPVKTGNVMVSLWHTDSYRGDHNLFFARRGPDERQAAFARFFPERDRFTLPAFREKTGQDRHSVFTNPGIAAVPEMRDYGAYTAEYREEEMHRMEGEDRPMGIEMFFVDPEVSRRHAAPGQVIGPDPSRF